MATRWRLFYSLDSAEKHAKRKKAEGFKTLISKETWCRGDEEITKYRVEWWEE